MGCSDSTRLRIDGVVYRGDLYDKYRSCNEVIIRGPFKDDCFKRTGNGLVFMPNCVSCFKDDKKGNFTSTDEYKSKKDWATDNKEMMDWRPFAHVYGRINYPNGYTIDGEFFQ